MQGTQVRIPASTGQSPKHRSKPALTLTIALIEMRLLELPASSLRRRVLEQMMERVQD
jgi:hypothetical protein